jgi:hypothetical protein
VTIGQPPLWKSETVLSLYGCHRCQVVEGAGLEILNRGSESHRWLYGEMAKWKRSAPAKTQLRGFDSLSPLFGC